MHESFEYTPGAALAPYVEHAVGYLHVGFPAGVHVGMPSCSLTLVISLDEPLTLSDGAAPRRDFHSVVAGLYASPTHIHHEGYQCGLQLALRPSAARALFGCRPAELADHSYEWADVIGPDAHRLRERLHERLGWAERLALVEQALTDRLTDRLSDRHSDPAAVAPEVGEAWRLVMVSGGRLPVREVARRVGWSTRHLEHQFAKEFGLTPKTASRVRRFERSRALVADPRRRIADVAAVCGYADQAHLARDWRDLAGLPPSRWRAEDALAFPDRSDGSDDSVQSDETNVTDARGDGAGQPARGAGRRHDRRVRAPRRTRQEEEP